jgi:NAD(P)H-hydrate repair Nnr-like enzyme with NAD(P)H-hydrate dehydratase domain
VLSGLIAGLCAMGISTYEGGLLGAYLAGKSAEFAVETIGEYSLTASDVISYLGGAFLHLTKD